MLLTLLFFIAAILYSSVGHAGASGYLAAMALVGMAPEIMKPTALTLNVVVASIACIRYTRAGQSDWKLLLPFIATSIPAAFIGGMIHLPATIYKPLVGLVLVVSAIQFIRTAPIAESQDAKATPPKTGWCMAAGAGLGFLAGLTGTGGGIFLSPLLILLHWAPTRRVSGIAAGFILLNSVAGLLGSQLALATLPEQWPLWAAAVLAGGFIGTQLGSKILPVPHLRRMLGVVLLIAGAKMLLA